MKYLLISLIVLAGGILLSEADPRIGKITTIVGAILVIVSCLLILLGGSPA